MSFLKNNWKLKLLSLIGAIVLWSFVIASENPSVRLELRDIPVIFENENILNENGLVLLNDNRPKVNITVRGQRSRIVNLTPQHIKISADLSEYDEGLNVLNLKYDLPKEVEMVGEPDPINVDIQKILTKKFHVDVEINGKIKENYLLESTKSTPETISVKGPRSKVESISKVRAVLDGASLTKDVVVNLDLEALTKDGVKVDNVTLGQNFVNVNVDVSKTKDVKLTPSTENALEENLRLVSIEIEPENLMIKGTADKVDKVKEIKTKSINLANIIGSTTIDTDLDYPSDISPVNNDTKFKAKITVERKVEKTILMPSSSIEFQGLKDDAIITFDKDQLEVRIVGFQEEILEITSEDIELSYTFETDQKGEIVIEPVATTKNAQFEIDDVESVRLTIN